MSGSVDKTLAVWNVSTGEKLQTLGENAGEVLDVASAGGRIVSASGKTCTVWNDCVAQIELAGHKKRVTCVAARAVNNQTAGLQYQGELSRWARPRRRRGGDAMGFVATTPRS